MPGKADAGGASRGVGYQPVQRWVNYGTVLQVRPELSDDGSTVRVDVTSISVLPNNQSQPATRAGAEIFSIVESLDLRVQQFKTSVRMTNYVPTLVGATAVETSEGTKKQTYLILESIVGRKP